MRPKWEAALTLIHALRAWLAKKGELYHRYERGLENQLGVLGLVLNCVVLWTTCLPGCGGLAAEGAGLSGPGGGHGPAVAVRQPPPGCARRLRQLVARMGAPSELSRISISDQAEMREMVIKAFATRAKDDLDRLAADIATATREGHSAAAVQILYKRFEGL
jgi:hypothetical protein